MDHLTLNDDDIKACLELACDGINLHLHDQSKLDVIHKLMYAIANSVQNDQTLTKQLATNKTRQYTVLVKNAS